MADSKVERLAKEFPSLAEDLRLSEERLRQPASRAAEIRVAAAARAPVPVTGTEHLVKRVGAKEALRAQEFPSLAQDLANEAAQKARGEPLDPRLAQEFPSLAKEDGVRQWQDQVATWRKELEADPDVMQNAELMRAFVREYGQQEFLDALEEFGGGDDPRIVRALIRMAKAATQGGRR